MTEKEYSLIVALNELSKEYNEIFQDPIYIKSNSHHKFRKLLEEKKYRIIWIKLVKRFKFLFKKPNIIIDKNPKHNVVPVYDKENYDLNNSYNNLPRVVVYSHISRGYDSIKEPLYINPDYDYVLYTDICIEKSEKSVWEYREIPENLKKLNNNTLINRYIKFHPHDLFPDYDFSVYIDGSIKIITDITPLLNIANISNVGIGLHQHMFRDCVYSEGLSCINLKKGKIENIQRQMEKYKREGLPSHFGLFEATVIVSDLNNPKGSDLFDSWYKEFSDSNSMRDQLALPYVIWKKGFSIEDIGFLGDNLKRNPMFRWYGHE